jgi:hypothetical protein
MIMVDAAEVLSGRLLPFERVVAQGGYEHQYLKPKVLSSKASRMTERPKNSQTEEARDGLLRLAE